MIKLTIVNIMGQPNGVFDLKKGYNWTLKNIQMEGFADDYLEVCEDRADHHLSNNLR